MLEESKKAESLGIESREALDFLPLTQWVHGHGSENINSSLQKDFFFFLATRKDCRLSWKPLCLDCMLVGINTIRWGRKGVIRELCIMAVRLVPKSGSGCEYLSWKCCSGKGLISAWKVGAGERRKSFSSCLQDCLPAVVARSPGLTWVVVPSDRAKIRHLSE